MPSVNYFYDELHISENYFGGLIKKETGKTDQEYIQDKIIDIAKGRIFDADKFTSELAYELDFKISSAFHKIIQQRASVTPNEYGNLI